jgi:hypothetical protein
MISNSPMKPFAPRLQIGKTGPQPDLAMSSECCAAARQSGHSCFIQRQLRVNFGELLKPQNRADVCSRYANEHSCAK